MRSDLPQPPHQEDDGTGETALGRERPIAVDTEHIKSREAQLLNARDPSETGDGENADWTKLSDLKGFLDAVYTSLDEVARILEQELLPALNEIRAEITTFNWDRVEEFRNRLITLTGRGRKVRERFERLLNVEGLEMPLEAYFLKIDGMLNRLSTLSEYLADTVEYANKMNRLKRMKVMVSIATLVMGVFGLLISLKML